MVLDMPTPQLIASASVQFCPICGRRMQHLSSSETTHSYICTAHSLQNSDTTDPYYLNIHYKFMDENGRVKEMPAPNPRKAEPNYDPRLQRKSS